MVEDRRLPYRDSDENSFVRIPCAICGVYVDPADDRFAVVGVHSDVRCSKHENRDEFPAK